MSCVCSDSDRVGTTLAPIVASSPCESFSNIRFTERKYSLYYSISCILSLLSLTQRPILDCSLSALVASDYRFKTINDHRQVYFMAFEWNEITWSRITKLMVYSLLSCIQTDCEWSVEKGGWSKVLKFILRCSCSSCLCDILIHVKSFFCNRELTINIFRDVYIKAAKR